jgi:hypothetical protein
MGLLITNGEFVGMHGDERVEADGGRLQVRGCTFDSPHPNIVLRKGLAHAITSENNGASGVSITNEIGDQAIIVNNEPFAAA